MPKFEASIQEEFPTDGLAETPAGVNLFEVNDKSPLLPADVASKTHRGIQMLAWLGSRVRAELLNSIAFLKTRVSALTEENLVKFQRIVKYL